jgi:hypothetical protein
MDSGLLAIARKGTNDQKEGEKQTQGEITENAQQGLHLSFLPSMVFMWF